MHELPPLPYSYNALEPYLSAKTLELHHQKHHQTYITNLNNLIKDSDFSTLSLEEIILQSMNQSDKVSIFNNAAQVWNHTFYWHCLTPNAEKQPSEALLGKIISAFGSLDSFKSEFKQAALSQFGSGWAWLVKDCDGKLSIIKTSNADSPITKGQKALLTCDVWEHAYYVDYQNRRAEYVDVFLNHLVNWDFVEKNEGCS